MHSSLLPATAALQTYTLPAQQKGQIENMVRALVERSKTGANKRHAPSTDSSEESDDGGEEAAEEQEAEEAEPQSPLPHAAPSRRVRVASVEDSRATAQRMLTEDDRRGRAGLRCGGMIFSVGLLLFSRVLANFPLFLT